LTEPDLQSEDHYHVLGLKCSAADKDVSAAYKRLALKYHPDKNLDDRDHAELVFKRITHAYETLRDPMKRDAYDNACNSKSFSTPGNSNTSPGDLGSAERADELYRRFFGTGGFSSPPNINVAGIFNFEQKAQAKPVKVARKVATPEHFILPGSAVAIRGLANKPDLNGKSARVREWSAAKGRYEVALTCGALLSLRPRNITQLCFVQVSSHDNQPELTGRTGEIMDFNEETGCYVVLMEDPALVIELPPKNCVFGVGTAGVLEGLGDEQLSGKMCSIISIDHNASRYVVQCEGGRQLKVRFEKVVF